MMTIKLALSTFAAVFLLSACETTPRVELSTEQATALKTTWLGKKWAGSWGGDCTGSVEVLKVSGNRAKVNYVWGQCGNSAPGSYVEPDAALSETEMKLQLVWGTTAHYTLQDDGNLHGEWRGGRGGEASGTFVLVQ